MEISVGTYSSVRYLVEVRYWECPLIESPLYIHMLIPYQTAKFKSANILAIAILGSSARFNTSGYMVLLVFIP